MAHLYLIWSHEHGAWWGPNGNGYVNDLRAAGRYTFAEAAEIVVPHIPPGEEVAVNERLAMRSYVPPRNCIEFFWELPGDA